jgi:acid phosphatase family membrane protein YuiD
MTIVACCSSAAVSSCRGSAIVTACCASTATADCRGSVVVAACCGPTTAAAPPESSLATVVVLVVARDALDERRLVGTVASDLNTLAGAREGTVGATLRRRRRES